MNNPVSRLARKQFPDWLGNSFLGCKSGRVSLLKLGVIGSFAIIFLCLGLRAGFKPGKSTLKEAQASPSSGWLSGGYGYQKAIVIDNTQNASNLSDYQVKVTNPIYDETGLVGSWHMDEASGTAAADTSGYANNGTATGTTVVTGQFGNARQFNGTSDYVQNTTPSGLPTGASARTIEAWIKPNTVSGNQAIASYGTASSTNWFYFYLSGNKLSFSGNSADTTGTAALSAGNWYHATVVYDGTNILFYLNGAFDASAAKSLNTIISGDGIRIGRIVGAGGDYFNGTIDEVRVYNRALSADEIKQHYEAKANPNYGDVRFTKSDGTTELPYWIEKDGTFWVKVSGTNTIPASGTYTMYMYYGNPSPPASTLANSGTNTFLFFDDFNDGNYTASPAWTRWATGGTWDAAAGYLVSGGSGDWDIYATSNYAANVAWEFKVRALAGTGGTGSQAGAALVLLSDDTHANADVGANSVAAGINGTNVFLSYGTAPTSIVTAAWTKDTAWHDIRVTRNSANLWELFFDGASKGTGTYTGGASPSSYLQIYERNEVNGWDNVRIRNYTSPEPTTNVYAEQENLLFNYQKSITLSPATPSANYQVKVTVGYTTGGDFNLGGNCKSDFSDIRFGDSLGNTYSYWLESYTVSGTATFWVKVPNASTSTMYIYYGNASAASASNGTNTFPLFDDFLGSSLNTALWEGSTSYASLSGGIMTYYAASGDYWLTSKNFYSSPLIVRSKNKMSTVSVTTDFGFQVNPYAAPYQMVETYGSTMNIQDAGASSVASNITTGSYTTKEIRWDDAGNSVSWYENDVQCLNSPFTNGANIPSVPLAVLAARVNQANTVNVDWILVRKYAATEPAVTASGTQTAWNAKANTYSWREPVTINNTGAGNAAQYSYQVPVTVDTASLISAGHMNADGSDIRFSATSDFNEENWLVSYPYWIESGINTSSTKIWVKVDSLAAAASKTIYMYYGNAGAASASNGTNTFSFFDDFSTTKSGYASGGTWSITGGVLKPTAGTWVYYLYNVGAPPYTIRTSIKGDATANWWGTIIRETSAYANKNSYHVQQGSANQVIAGVSGGSSATYAATGLNNYHLYETKDSGNAVDFYFDDTYKGTSTATTNNANTYAGFGGSPSLGTPEADWWLVRKYAANDPSGTPGTEENGTPAAPSNCAIQTPTSTTQLTITWTDNSSNETSFVLERSTDGVNYTALTPAAANATTATDTGLTANTRYWYGVAAKWIGTSAYSTTASPKYTLPEAPAAACDKALSTWYNTAAFTFTNNAGGDATFGAGHLDHYHYLWDQTATRTQTQIEAGATWSSGTLALSATADGSWYLHLVAHNGDQAANSTTPKVDLGPYNYDGTVPTATGFTLYGNGTAPDGGSVTYVNGMASPGDNQVVQAVGIFNDSAGSSGTLLVQFSEDQTNWGAYNGTVNQTDTGWTYAQTITASGTAQSIAGAWKFATPDGSKTLYYRVKDSAGNVRQ